MNIARKICQAISGEPDKQAITRRNNLNRPISLICTCRTLIKKIKPVLMNSGLYRTTCPKCGNDWRIESLNANPRLKTDRRKKLYLKDIKLEEE